MNMNQMMSDKRVAYGLLAVGIVGVLLSFLIDPIRGYDFHMAAIQWVVLVVGIVLAVAGAYLSFMRKPPVPPMAG
jgi:hypothetical protein